MADKTEIRCKTAALLKYFNSDFYTLAYPSRAYKAAGASRYEIAKLNIQLKMQSGRYRTSRLCRFWSGGNKAGVCMVGNICKEQGISETICHIITSCVALEPKRQTLKNIWYKREPTGPLSELLKSVFSWDFEEQTKFILDPLSNAKVISLIQKFGDIILNKVCYLTRTFCFSLHRERKILLGEWSESGFPAPEKAK